MLVSSIARFDALNTMNNSMFASMKASNNLMRLVQNGATFGGEHDLAMLHEMDKRMTLDLATNGLLYKLAYFQEKMLAKMQADELKNNKVNYLA